jgi:UDP-perosamine 4-acetyltransferase
MPDDVVMIGAGGHARVVYEAMRLSGLTAVGAVSLDSPKVGFPLRILGDDKYLEGLPRSTSLVMGVGGSHSTALRQRLFENAKSLGFSFLTIVHPIANVASDAVLGEGCQIMAGAMVQVGVRLGANVIINTGAVVDHDGQIGDHAHIAPGAALAGDVTVGKSALIGTGARLRPGVSVGMGTVIGAGAAVVHNIPDMVVAFGVPCRVVSARTS